MTKMAGGNQGRMAGGGASSGLKTVALRNEFYRDGFNKALLIAAVTSIWAVLATAFGIGALMYKPKPPVIASTPMRSEERRVGKEGVSTCRSWGAPYP